jgi:superfamily I DNA/RNA helicase
MVDPATNSLLVLYDDAKCVAELLGVGHQEGHAWGDMVIKCRHYSEMGESAGVKRQRGLPHQVRKGAGSFDPAADTIKVLTMHATKGLEFPVVALVRASHIPAANQSEKDEARLFYVGATRATQRLIIGLSGDGQFATRFA